MEDVLIKMDPEKRHRLINSALEEFSNNTYDKASTNNIVKKAGISKGLLYHYFKSKKSLYDYLIAFSVKVMIDPIMAEVGWEESDIINRIKKIALIKLRVAEKYPNVVAFLKSMYNEKSYEEVKSLFDQYLPDLYHQLYHYNIDFSLFKDDVDVRKAINVIQWSVEKFSEGYLEIFKAKNQKFDFQTMIQELNQYLELFRKVFYK